MPEPINQPPLIPRISLNSNIMKTEKIIWGLVLIFIGTVRLLQNFDVIDFHWGVLTRLWPLIPLLIGANLLLNRTESKMGSTAALLITVGILGVVFFAGTNANYRSGFSIPGIRYTYRDTDQEDKDVHNDHSWSTKKESDYVEWYNPETKHAALIISGGGMVYSIKDSTDSLFRANVKHTGSGFSFTKVVRDSVLTLRFKQRSGKHMFNWSDDDDSGNKAVIKLSNRPSWDITVNMGAGEADFDLTPFKVRNLEFKGGVASFNAKLGMPETVTNVVAETGAASVEISIPKDAGCLIKVSSGFSSHEFPGFDKQNNDSYTTENYNSASKKIIISLNGGMSGFKVSRY